MSRNAVLQRQKLFTGLTPLRCTPVYRGQARLIGQCQSKSSCPERLHNEMRSLAVSAQSQVMPDHMQG